MTVKKAIKLLEWWINQREEKIKEISTTIKFNDKDIETVLINNEKTVIENLKLIKKELVPKCRHPKKMQDTCDGKKYCMSCNLDL